MMTKISNPFPKKRIDSFSLTLQIDKDVSSLEEQLEKKKVSVEYGYFYIYWIEHPNATKSGKVFLHRHIAAVTRGEWLRKDEIVAFQDGDKTNLLPKNLLITTRAACGRGVNYLPKGGDRQDLICEYCGKEYSESYAHAKRRKTCSPLCSQKLRRKFDPDPAELEELVWEMPTTKVAELFGVSDKAISKRCKLYEIEKPPRGYWAKVNAGQFPAPVERNL